MSVENAREPGDLKKSTVGAFLPLYNSQTAKEFRVISHQEQPGVVLEAEDGTQLGLEICHLPHGQAATKTPSGGSDLSPAGVQDDLDMVTRLNALLDEKARQGRSVVSPYPVSLVVRGPSGALSSFDLNGARDLIRVPDGVYHEVWLLADQEHIPGWPYLIRLG